MKKYCILCKNDDLSLRIREKLLQGISLPYDESCPDYVVTIGGDGTILGAIQKYMVINQNLIVFGIHTGHLGFFTNYTVEDVDQLIYAINTSDYFIESAGLLEFYLDKKFGGFALNEVTILCPTRTLILDVFIDDEKLETYRGTGLCISTASGSTAYNKSLHGSVIDSSLDVLQLTEIAGINSNSYRTLTSPLVLNSNRKIVLKAKEESPISITYDNQVLENSNVLEMECRYSNFRIRFAANKNQSFLNRIKRTFI